MNKLLLYTCVFPHMDHQHNLQVHEKDKYLCHHIRFLHWRLNLVPRMDQREAHANICKCNIWFMRFYCVGPTLFITVSTNCTELSMRLTVQSNP